MEWQFELLRILNLPHIKEIELRSQNVQPETLLKASRALAEHQNLQTLSLTETGLGDEGLEILLAGILESKTITELDVSQNPITGAVIPTLEKLMWKVPGLRVLRLNGTLLDDKDATVLARVLAANPPLTKLEVVDTKISNKGAVHLAQALQVNTNLEQITLRVRPIGATGCSAFAELHRLRPELLINGIDMEAAIRLSRSPAVARQLKRIPHFTDSAELRCPR